MENCKNINTLRNKKEKFNKDDEKIRIQQR